MLDYLEMDKIEEDIKEIAEDINKINCNPVIKFFVDCYKCINDLFKLL